MLLYIIFFIASKQNRSVPYFYAQFTKEYLIALFSSIGDHLARIFTDEYKADCYSRERPRARDFHVAVAVACLHLRPLRFCGLHAGADRFSGCVPAYRARRAAIPLALRGKARRTHVIDGRRTCERRSLAAGAPLESTETIWNKDDVCGRGSCVSTSFRRYESATRDRFKVVRELVMLYLGIIYGL